MNLLDAFKQYIRDAMPGGALNPEVTTQGVLDAAALGTAPVPVLGDAIGLAADVKRLKDNPKERTPANFALAGLGVLPFVPGMAGMTKAAKAIDALRPPQADALETARKNAVTMLGLPPNNTPMDRAKALGFVDDAYHGTSADIRSFNTAGKGKTSGSGAFFTDNPNVASTYASYEGGNVIPVMLRSDFPVNVMANGSNWNWLGKGVKVDGPKTPTNKATKKTLGKLFPDFFRYEDALSTDDVARWSSGQGYDAAVFNAVKDRGPNGVFHTSDAALPSKNTAVFNPANIRSRFAAFDPARINENDLLGRADLGLLGLLAGGSAGAAYLMRDEEK